MLNTTSYSNPVHLPYQYKPLSGYHIPQPTGSLSHSPLSDINWERGGPASCPNSQRQSRESKQEHMSHTPPASEPLKDDPLRTDSCRLSEKKRPRVDDDSHSSEVHDLVRPRPLSWRPSAPVEPPLQAAQLRSLGVLSILNSPTKSAPPCLVDLKYFATLWARPFVMFVREPIVLWLSLLSGFSDALIFTFLQSYEPVYKQWNFNTITIGLAFIP